MEKNIKSIIKEYAVLTFATVLLVIGVYVFKFPNNFSFGGVTGIAVILAAVLPFSATLLTNVINIALLAVGFVFLGKDFGVRTVYVVVLNAILMSVCEHFFPMSGPLTSQPVLELIFAIVLPALCAAILFNMDASSGGTDIVAMILKKHTTMNISTALTITDTIVAVASFFFYGPETGLFSVAGLLAKALVIDGVIENINKCKYFTIITENPKPIVEFIHNEIDRSATTFTAEGAYMHHEKTVILVVTNRHQAVLLRRFVHNIEPTAFLMITNSSEIIGKGFRGLN